MRSVIYTVFIGLLVGVLLSFVLLYFPATAKGNDVYGRLLPSTVTRSVIGFQQFGPYLQLNPVSRNVRPYDNQPVINPYNFNRVHVGIKSKKRHPKDVICNKLNFFHVDIR